MADQSYNSVNGEAVLSSELRDNPENTSRYFEAPLSGGSLNSMDLASLGVYSIDL